jgi:TolB-like protein/Tfp pilus assembly protein PilF
MECPNCLTDNPDDSRFCSKCGKCLVETPATPPDAATTRRMEKARDLEFQPGQHFGKRYQIVEEIGRGGMGVVYKALDKELDRVVALKMIRPELGADPGVVEQFKKELVLASEVTHENVIRIHDLGEADGIRYISMKYIDGTSLGDLLNAAGVLTPQRAIFIARQVCHALTAAHSKGVIHRDLKPQNIMLDRKGTAYVMDFGIARSTSAADVTTAGAIVGTPNYISPEQAKGRPGDARSDIYSLGCILYEMLTGRRPFQGRTVEALIHSHLNEMPTPPSRINPGIAGPLEAAVLRCLEKDPASRFDSAAALSVELERVVSGSERRAETAERTVTAVEETAQTSIAVLPFRDMSPQKDQEYFCDGMAEELTNALVKVEGLRVAAMTSALRFKDKTIDIREIGRQLGVGTVLEGSVRKAGNRLRVTAQLVNVGDGYHLWSERYDREMEDVFAIQDEISEAIVRALRLKLVDSKGGRIECCGTRNAEAYNLYLKGRYYWNRRTPDALKRSIDYYKRAIELDPSYALAYAGLADTYIMLEDYKDAQGKAEPKQAALKALSLDDSLAEPHAALAWIAFGLEHDHETAEREFRRAIELNPNYATGHQWYALFLVAHGRFDEAFEHMGIAKSLDPLSLIIMSAAGWVFSFAGRYDEAMAESRKALEMDPNFAPAHLVLAKVHMLMGMESEATEEFRKVFTSLGAADLAEQVQAAYEASGYRAGMMVIIDNIQKEAPHGLHSPMLAAQLWAILGEMEEAFAALEQAYEKGEGELILILRMEEFHDLRSDPRFQDLARRLGLPPEASER